jgi:hypothetical protein
VKVGDLVRWHPIGAHARPRYCIVTSADDRYVTLTGFSQNQVFQRPDQFVDGIRRPSPLEIVNESR